MKTETMTITSQIEQIRSALTMTENLALQNGLEQKAKVRLRLLAEELMGLMRGVTDQASAEYWIEQDGRQYVLHLAADVKLNRKMREQILAISSTGENAAVKGFMGKLKDMIATAFLPADEFRVAPLSGLSLGLMSMAGNASPQAQQASVNTLNWSMQRYKAAIEKDGAEDREERKAELEHSIVASIADEVTASVKGSHVEITIHKAF